MLWASDAPGAADSQAAFAPLKSLTGGERWNVRALNPKEDF